MSRVWPFNTDIMKKIVITLAITLFIVAPGFSHYMWLETSNTGMLGKKHEVKVYFGEYTYRVFEETSSDAYKKMANFKLWVIAPDGAKTALKPTGAKDHYTAYFVPEKEGAYTLVLNNNEIEVIDYTQYDFGIFKTHYHSTAKVLVGNENADTKVDNALGLAIKEIATEDKKVTLQIFYKEGPLKEQEVKIFVADLWSKTLQTDDKGKITFALPWKTTYTVETTFSEKVPGTYKGEDYEFIWHCATYCIK